MRGSVGYDRLLERFLQGKNWRKTLARRHYDNHLTLTLTHTQQETPSSRQEFEPDTIAALDVRE